MRVFWMLIKIIVGLAIAIPLGIVALALTVGLVGTLVGLAFVALKLAVVGLVGYGVYRFARMVFAPSRPTPLVAHELPLPRTDKYYEAAMRELDSELGPSAR